MKDKEPYKSTSRRRTVWTDKVGNTPLQEAIDQWNRNNYERRHPLGPDSGETRWLNSIELKECKHCGSKAIKRFGKTRTGINRYRCNECLRTFTPLTNTIFDNRQIPLSEWHDFILDILSFSSKNLASKGNRNSINTTNYWLKKIFLVLRHYQDNIVLQDKVYIDETFYSVIKRDIKEKEPGIKYRGASINQICIGVGCDSYGSVFCVVEGLAHTSRARTLEAFGSHIKEGSILLHDEEKSHSILVEELALESKTYNSKELKKLPDDKNPLNPVNRVCHLLKSFLKAHSGFDRDYLQDYLNLFSFMMNPPNTKPEKVEEFFKMAINVEILLRYRDQNIK